MRRPLVLLLTLTVTSVVVAACGSTGGPSAHRSTPTPPTPPASASPSAGASTSPGAAAAYPTGQQAADAGAQQSGLVPCADQYPGQPNLISAQVDVYDYDSGPCGGGPHAGLFVWVYHDGSGWHPYTWAATQYADLPTAGFGAQIPMQTGGGCVNAHSSPSAGAPVVACLGSDTTVVPGAPNHSPWNAPVWDGQRLWWYVFRLTSPPAETSNERTSALGWVDLEYLICGRGPHDLNLNCTS